jgi:hypothetical protein
MKIYRVYSSYHESSESGTYDYGYYTDHERAKQRAKDVWANKGYGEYRPEDISPNGSIHVSDGWGICSINVQSIELDVDTDHNTCGYT